MIMSRLDNSCVDAIVHNCLHLFETLPKSGKPVDKEWTVLSCVVQRSVRAQGAQATQVVALGTGSKCAGGRALSAAGTTLNDSHAEVIARRAFLLYLYDNISYALNDQPSIFKREGNKFRLREDLEFIFYSSQLPCGDASILPKNIDEEVIGNLLRSCKRSACEDVLNDECKKIKLETDIHRTGAKCLPYSAQDPKLPGPDYHFLGRVRTKPGRGDPTLSVSCSDKIARWIHVGIQGALLDILCEPVYIQHFVFGAGVPYSEESLNRALLCRNRKDTLSINCTPQFYQTSVLYTNIKTEVNVRPAPGSIIWSRTLRNVEVAVNGKRQGLTKKQAVSQKHALSVSKLKLYEKFLNILEYNEDIKRNLFKECSIKNIPYNAMNKKSVRYYKNWQEVKQKLFGSWTVKPDMWNFCVMLMSPEHSAHEQ